MSTLSGPDQFTTVAVDNSGNAVVGGWTSSNELVTFPVKVRVWVPDPKDYNYGGHWEDQGSNAYDAEFNGGTSDAIVVKFSADGLLSFSTYFGGAGEDRASRVLTDNEGRIMLVGTTRSANLPIPEGGVSTLSGKTDAFAFGLSADGLRLRSCLYYGGDGDDIATDASWDASYNVIITGSTTSNTIPQLGAGTTSARVGQEDGFLTKLTSSEILYSTLFGWSGSDVPLALTCDALGDCFVAGRTSSSFSGNVIGGAHDGFIAKWAFGTLAMRSPLAGALICTGTQVPISWISEDISPTSTYAVSYSTDEGVTWTVAASGIKQKSYLWTVPSERPTSGRIMIRVSSVNGHTSVGASPYIIESAPKFVQQPQSGTYCPGSRIELAPEVDGGNATYQWRKNGVNIDGATQRVFVIGTASSGDAGAYDLVATTVCKATTSAAATVGVSAQPTISTQPLSSDVQPGVTVVLRVSAAGQSLTYQWEFNGAPIPSAIADSLVLPAITSEQTGKYRCVVGSACGSTTSSEAVIKVGTVSIDPDILINSMIVAPQPATESVRVITPRALSASATIRLYSVQGVDVGNQMSIASTSSSTFTLTLRSLPNGAYTLVVNDGTESFSQALMVSR
ncbi:MAG: immunoglobulin domain-containing protein [Candidatus Kapabacteria bacterium]|nr:immunoglobulin domain-containing protein [Candidatus Kapabacteria bacterium]